MKKQSFKFLTALLVFGFVAALLVFSPIIVRARSDTQFSVVTPEWVASHYNDANLRILDVRPDPHDYFAGHIPNAVHMADATMRGPLNGVPVQYLPPEMLATLLSRAGVSNSDRVLLYSDKENVLGATMVAYVLERIGHPNVMVMDGGWTAYKASQQKTQEYPKYTPDKLTARDNKSIRVTLDEVKNLMSNKGVKFIDARPEKAYRGEITTWMRNGHIPGAISSDWHMLMDPANLHKFKSMDEIQKIYQQKQIDKSQDIVLYCGTSREASLEYMVLKHMMGYPKVRLYEGSWTEYSAHSELPVATGDGQVTEK
jgi:thiosulfate/3-mercaptopyruvate sulfurtransferase